MISRKMAALLAVCMILGAACIRTRPVGAQTHGPWTIESVLGELNSHASDFHSLSADLARTKVTVVVDDRSTSMGTILVRGDKMLLQMNPPDARTILKTGDSLYVYTPGLKRVEEYNLGKNRALVDEFMLLGFGTRGTELRKSYQVSIIGEPTVGDKKAVELQLVSKSKAVQDQFSKIQIWFDTSTWLPLQQQFYETGSGDYSIIRYSNIVRNPAIRDSEFKAHWPKGTEKIRPQG